MMGFSTGLLVFVGFWPHHLVMPLAVSYLSGSSDWSLWLLAKRGAFATTRAIRRNAALWLIAVAAMGWPLQTHADILWSDLGANLAHATGDGTDILSGAVKRDDSSSDTLYFKFQVDPLSDVGTEEYLAAFGLYEGGEERLALGNSLKAWAYSAFNTAETGASNRIAGDFDLHSSRPESSGLGAFYQFEFPRRGVKRTVVFKVQYVRGADDLVTVWLSPNLARGGTDGNQRESLTTKFKANASFDQVRLRHAGSGNGWIFSDMAMATSFRDFIVPHFWQTGWFLGLSALAVLAGVGASVRIVERKKFQRRLQLAEQERALERERSRIAQDLHDDLGSSLTRISLLSDLAKADKDDPTQVEVHMDKISQSAAQSVRALEEIVWAVRPSGDSLQSLVEYIAHFANELFEGDGTRCRLDLPHDLPARPLPPEVRHNIFLVVKEALANVLKHASAKEVRVQARATGNSLEILVQDDGQGFALEARPLEEGRHGLGNMRRRAEALGGMLTLQSAPGKGTTIRLVMNFPSEAATGRT